MKKITWQIITFVLSYVILSLGPVYGQDLSDINPSMNIKQNDLSHKFMLEDYSLKSKKHYNKKKTYFWYKAQKIIATQGGSAGTLLNGKYQSFYKNKQLCEQGEFENGLKSGVWKKWDNDGQLTKVERWNNGKQLRRQDYYNEDGQVEKRVWISRFKKEIQTMDTTVVIRGQKQKITLKDSLGRKSNIQRYRNGFQHGSQIEYDEAGEKSKTVYKKGKLQLPKIIEEKEPREKKVREEKQKKVKESRERKKKSEPKEKP